MRTRSTRATNASTSGCAHSARTSNASRASALQGRSAVRLFRGANRVRSGAMTETRTEVRVDLAREGVANVATGLPVLDHLVGELARAARFKLSLEVGPGSTDEAVAAAGRGLGAALGERLATNA